VRFLAEAGSETATIPTILERKEAREIFVIPRAKEDSYTVILSLNDPLSS
jgi:hypothetical protein